MYFISEVPEIVTIAPCEAMVSDPASVAGVSTAESRVNTIVEVSSILKLCAPPSAVPTVIFDWSALKVMRVAVVWSARHC